MVSKDMEWNGTMFDASIKPYYDLGTVAKLKVREYGDSLLSNYLLCGRRIEPFSRSFWDRVLFG